MSRTLKRILLSMTLFGCAADPATTTNPQPSPGGKGDAIGPSDDPNILIDNATFRLGDLVTANDIGKTFGTDDAHIPYPDTYWPFVDEGTDQNWNMDATPTEKYMGLLDSSHVADAKSWEKTNHGSDLPGVASWYGHCPGWTASALLNAPLQHGVYAMADGNGGLKACDGADSSTCTWFEIGDINALMAEAYVDAASRFIGGRCDTKPADIQRDANGRIVRTGSGCQGLNAGALLVVAGNVMKIRQKPFAIDAQNDANTDQIWNQPAYRYTMYRFYSLNEAQAANLVVHGTFDGDQTHYQWNDAARGWVMVDIGLKWVSENGPNTTVVSGADSTRETRMVAVIELDGPGTNYDSKVIGGEYVDDSTVGADRLTVPPFVWMATDAGPDDSPRHNPYIKSSAVKQLVSLAQQPQ
jgi:hypothetical protein